MNDSGNFQRDTKRVALTNVYTFPLTVILLAMGLALSQPVGLVRNTSLGLIFFYVAFNLVAVRMVARGSGHIFRLVKLYTNLAINSAVVFILGQHWSPMWLILVLAPVSAAVYGTRRQALVSAAQASVILLIIQALRGRSSALDWGEQLAQVFFVVILTLLINSARAGEPAPASR
jgi:hypothetical protein